MMIPIPQYPLYSALLALKRIEQVHYYLKETENWSISIEELERSFKEADDKGVLVKSMTVINPGNPTGQVLREESMRQIVKFCYEKKLVLLADEVY
jgi:aspartate/methionine/tyrosine aminotransferase